MVLVGLCLALLVLIIAGFVILGGKSVVLLLDLVKAPLNELLGLFRYPPKSGRALLTGTLPLRYCAARFACRTPTWRLPVSGHVFDLVAAGVGAVREVLVDGSGLKVHWVSGSGPGRKKIRLNRKFSCTPRRVSGSISSTGLEEVASCRIFQCFRS